MCEKKGKSDLVIKKSSFHPSCDLKDMFNYKTYNRIERDGTIFERVFLDIPDMTIREKVICLHFLKNQVMTFYTKEVAFNIISRDKPWDFKIELSTKEIFNIEITSIAENSQLFEKLKKEERFISKSNEDKIPLHELEKLNTFFPTIEITKSVEIHKQLGVTKNELVNNPYYKHKDNIFLSSAHYEEIELKKLIEDAILKKERKKHSEKENTILIIDNRTLTYEYSDLFLAIEGLEDNLKLSEFKEIWFYTGYCSELDGNNAEFSLAPLKIGLKKRKIIEKSVEHIEPNNNGIRYL